MKQQMNQMINASRPSFKYIVGVIAVVASIVAGCVTVNVNFPESAVQKATDDYVKDIYRSKEQSKTKASPTPVGTSSRLNFALIATAYAEDTAVFSLASSEIDGIKNSMKGRISDLIAQKKEGFLGETNDGSLVIRDAGKIKPLLKKRVEDLVRDENADRQKLYAAIVKENKLSSNNLAQVKKSFTRSLQNESPSGTWVQSPEGAWSQKP